MKLREGWTIPCDMLLVVVGAKVKGWKTIGVLMCVLQILYTWMGWSRLGQGHCGVLWVWDGLTYTACARVEWRRTQSRALLRERG